LTYNYFSYKKIRNLLKFEFWRQKMSRQADVFLKIGDIIEANKSWCISSLSEDGRTVTIDQNFKHIDKDTGGPVVDDTQEILTVVDTDGPKVNNVHYYGKTAHDGQPLTLAWRVEQAGLSLKGMRFVVIHGRRRICYQSIFRRD
jgi:hypothetical protein